MKIDKEEIKFFEIMIEFIKLILSLPLPYLGTIVISSFLLIKPIKDWYKRTFKGKEEKEITPFNSFFKRSKRDFESHDSLMGHYEGDFFKSFDRMLDMCRKQGEMLILDFSTLKTVNSFASKDFVDIIYKLIRDNVVELKVIFPKEECFTDDVESLYKKIYLITKEKRTIHIKTDVRKEER